ncbi:MAG: NAD(P)/FAD-dependent oxidoreductase [Clostridiales bacterium]|nr:NAD(P)/FAD-dependent oxidoreductase [Eubacteriales bacterium]MDH7566575.1 NAD(P)/FAD-dependent oxidoreductase [Clostridiales bacterium]
MEKVVIMGAGPAGLSAGYHLAKNALNVTLLEADRQVGGISKTIKYKNYYFDLGGHRFFTKFEEVDRLWKEVLGEAFRNTPRLSRIYYNNRFFNYPLTPVNALSGVGIADTAAILLSYLKARMFPYEREETFEQWVSNRFGKKLYSIFFKTYTEKVWGIPCSEIQAEWAAQRIKGLSLSTAIRNALFKPKNTNIKTLIDQFNYPVYGPGMMYNEMSRRIERMGGIINLNSRVTRVNHENSVIKSIEYVDGNGHTFKEEGDHFISSIPLTELIGILHPAPGKEVAGAAQSLSYRSIITVDVIVNRREVFPDNWIYIHSPEVKLGRIQNFKNWSAQMVPDPDKTSLGLEYFCTENDNLWNMADYELFRLASSEIEKIRICKASEIEDYTVVRVPKAYPVYAMGYQRHIAVIREYLKSFVNLHLVGRYGLFKYNNMDHSVMTGLCAAKKIMGESHALDTWDINTDEEYQEEKREDGGSGREELQPVRLLGKQA